MQRYLQRQLLMEYGIDEFDAWAATFGDIVTQVELAPSGKGFRTARSFSKFVNIPELIALYSRVRPTDTQTSEMLQLERPRLQERTGDRRRDGDVGTRTWLIWKASSSAPRRSRESGPEAGRDNMLEIFLGEGLRLAIRSSRLLDANAPNQSRRQDSIAAVERIARIWEAGKAPGPLPDRVPRYGRARLQEPVGRPDESAGDVETDESEPQIESGG